MAGRDAVAPLPHPLPPSPLPLIRQEPKRPVTQPPPWLRTAAHNQSSQGEPSRPPRVLFICSGNICRSAFAASCLSANPRTKNLDVGSAGTTAVVGHGIDGAFARIAESLGVDSRGHRARQLTGRMLEEADIILVFGPEHRDWIFIDHPDASERVLALGQAGAVLSRLSPRVTVPWWSLTGTVLARRPVPQPDDWIDDPYGRGDRAARATAKRITDNLDLLARRVSWDGRRTRAEPSGPPPARAPRAPRTSSPTMPHD